MRALRFVSALGLLALGGAINAHADIKYQINGGTITTPSFNSGRAVVNLGAVTTDLTVHVFDDATSSTTGPSIDLDGIELQADLGTPPAAVKIKLIVGNEDTETDFRATPLLAMDAGVIDFGVTSTQAIVYVEDNSNHDALRDAVILALAVSGNVDGGIEAGRIWRVQASSTGTGLGLIKGSIDAYAKDDLEFMPFPANDEDRELGEYAINVVTAARGIEGDIESKFSGVDFTGGGIARVQVTGVSSGVVGLMGHVISNNDIGSVFSAGPIGVINDQVKIYAQGRIEQIRTIDGSGDLQTVDTDMDIRTGVIGISVPLRVTGYDEGTPTVSQLFTGDPSEDAPLGLVEVGGDYFKGNVDVLNLAPVPGLPTNRSGIIVHGTLGPETDVNIAYNLDYSKIVARKIENISITVGLRMIGCIVEFGRDLPDPPASNGPWIVSIGSRGFEPTSIDSIPEDYSLFTIGMTGIDVDPVDMTQANWWLTDREGGTFDSLIRLGRTISKIRVFRMTLETEPGEHKQYMPRVECDTLAGHLVIGSMEAGVVWSGHVYDPAGVAQSTQVFNPANPDDYFMKLSDGGTADIGCVSPTADLWLRDFLSVNIEHDLLGELHVPELSDEFGTVALPFQVVRIGDRLGNWDTGRFRYDEDLQEIVCNCGGSDLYLTEVDPCPGQITAHPGNGCHIPCPFDYTESSPRGFNSSTDVMSVGHVRVAEPLGMEGQVVINARNQHEYPDCGGTDFEDAYSYWSGRVVVQPVSGPTPVTLAPMPMLNELAVPDCCFTAQPVHTKNPNSYGGGEAGEVPFRIRYEYSTVGYARDCEDTVGTDMISAQQLVATAGPTGPAAIRIRYDGPIDFQFGGGTSPAPAVVVYTIDANGDADEDVTHLFDATIDPTTQRDLLIWPLFSDPAMYLDPAASIRHYRVFPVRGVDSMGDPYPVYTRLICDDAALLPEALGSQSVPVSDETFDFRLYADCNGNEQADPDEIYLELLGGAVVDCNGDGIIDACWIMEDPELDLDEDGYLDECQTGCEGMVSGDFDCDSNIDLLDLLSFVETWVAEGQEEEFPDPALTDVNGDEVIDMQDVVLFVLGWINQCECD